MSSPDQFLAELGPDRVWHVAYHYYLQHRLHGLGNHGRLLSVILCLIGGGLQILSLYQPRVGLTYSQAAFCSFISAICLLAGITVFLFWLRLVREARWFACSASDSHNCTEQDIAILYQAISSQDH